MAKGVSVAWYLEGKDAFYLAFEEELTISAVSGLSC